MKIFVSALSLTSTFALAAAYPQCEQYEALFTAPVIKVQEKGNRCHVDVSFDVRKPSNLFQINTLCPLLIEDVLFHGFDVQKSTLFAGKNCGIEIGSMLSGVLVQKDGTIVLEQ